MAERKAYELFKSRKQSAGKGGGGDRLEKQHAAGKLSAHERLEFLFDEGTFQELDSFVQHRCLDFGMDYIPGDGVIIGSGTINGRLVHAYSLDFTVYGGTLSEANTRKICKLIESAMKCGTPIVGLNDSGGSRIQEGVRSLAGIAEIFYRNVRASGVIPQISAIMGPCAGGAVYSPALTDFIVMVEKTSCMFLTGPEVVKAVTHEEITKEELGGAHVHTEQSGVAHFAAKDDKHCLLIIRELLSFLPNNRLEEPPVAQWPLGAERQPDIDERLDDLIPEDPRTPYDVKQIITSVVDDGYFVEVQEAYARNLVIGFARVTGRPIGVVANQPMELAGSLDADGSRKGARFIRLCDAFNIPVVTFVDVPGFMPGSQQEQLGVIRDGAKLLFAYCEATVPKICFVMRKAYGGAYCVMSSKHLRGDYNFIYPGAEIAVMGPEGAINIIYRKDISGAGDAESVRQRKTEEYREQFANPYVAAGEGYVDEIIMPSQTREKLIMALDRLQNKVDVNPQKKHGNIPL